MSASSSSGVLAIDLLSACDGLGHEGRIIVLGVQVHRSAECLFQLSAQRPIVRRGDTHHDEIHVRVAARRADGDGAEQVSRLGASAPRRATMGGTISRTSAFRRRAVAARSARSLVRRARSLLISKPLWV